MTDAAPTGAGDRIRGKPERSMHPQDTRLEAVVSLVVCRRCRLLVSSSQHRGRPRWASLRPRDEVDEADTVDSGHFDAPGDDGPTLDPWLDDG